MSRVTQQPEFAKDIRLFSMVPFLKRKQHAVYETREERIDYHHNLWNRYVLFSQGLNLIARLLVYTVLYFAVLREINPLSIGSFTLYLALADAFSGALIVLLQRFGDFSRASMEVDDLRSFLDLKTDADGEYLSLPETDSLELQDNFFHEGWLVDFGQPYIDVKHVRARFLLLDALAEDVIQVFLSQSLLEALLPRGINSLPDQYRAGADPDCP